MLNSLFYNWYRYLQPFVRNVVVKLGEEKGAPALALLGSAKDKEWAKVSLKS